LSEASAPLADLALYVHWPYCARICPYCDFNVVRDRGQAEQAALADAIIADLAAQRALTGPRRLTSIYLGGGTPSLMRPNWAAAIIEQATMLWRPADDLEITLEANPTDAEAGRFGDFASLGVQRLSLGVQSFDDAALKFLGRNHDAAQALAAIEAGIAAFPRLSFDLIYALPGQTAADWRDQLLRAVALGAEHISPYQLTFEAGTALERAMRRGQAVPPPNDLAADLFETTQDLLSAAGYDAYEVSNHARGGAARSRHNLAYWTGGDYAGAGPGAHGRLTLEGGRIATFSHSKVSDYIAAVAAHGLGYPEPEKLNALAVAQERLLMGLRTDAGVPLGALAPLGLAATTPRLLRLEAQGLVKLVDGRLQATQNGRMVLDRLTFELAAD
jgi:putative oxygen-independent coproporphyrinogen III oxidase